MPCCTLTYRFWPTCWPMVDLGGVAGFRRRLDLERVEVQRVADRLGELPGDGARRQPLRPLRERNLLAFTQLVHRLVEDDQREDVGLLERRRAGQHDLGLLQRATHVDARFDALNQPPGTDIEDRVQLFGADEPHRAIAQDLEAPALEVVVAANGVHRADQTEPGAGILLRADVAAERQVERAKADRRTGRLQAGRLDDQIVGDRQAARRPTARPSAPTTPVRRSRRSPPGP